MGSHSSLHSKEITSAVPAAVSFGFFSDDEVRKISVKQVVSPLIFDNLKCAIRGGLYDPAFGPMDSRERCATCRLSHYECPGHFGHIELAVPIYNPLVFTQLYKLLRCTCLHCFKFKMAGAEVERFRRRLQLLSQGRLVEAQSLVVGTSASAKKAGGELVDEAMDLDDVAITEGAKGVKGVEWDYDVGASLRAQLRRGAGAGSAAAEGPRAPCHMSAQTLEAMIDAIGEFFRRQPSGKCQNCGAHNPTIKKEGHSKLFMLPLPPKKRAANQAQSTPILTVLQRHASAAKEVEALEAELGAGLERESRKRRRGPGGGSESEEIEEEGSGEEKKDFKPGEEEADDDMSEDIKEDSMEGGDADALIVVGGRPSKARKVAALERALEGVSTNENPKYLSPAEVQEIMRRMWELNEPVLAYIYPTDVARRQRRRGAGPAAAAAAGNATAQRQQGYREFFLHTVPVAPNRFRPANHVGDAVYEHPQNTLLMKAINANMDLVAATKESEAQEGLAGRDATPEVIAQAQLGRTLRHWQELQNAVNALFDTSSAQDSFGVQGIRQQLEKKEGLFRKNMMGKRVNFAARSVISPDVYLNGGEIGVPPYFASRLSFPERVTPWNLEKLREAVIAGPGRNPGAVAVEDERGRIVMLRANKKTREAVAKTLGAGMAGASTTPRKGKARTSVGSKIVYRTMEDGDFMLTNRQPTLHKPGMMGHRARIMRSERTIRFHYANCSTFNADFDGDEINLHLPQDHLGRAEGYNIVHADEQFFVPTDGKPLRGLIQDHIVAATLLTMRDRFLTQQEFCQLVYDCIASDCSGAWDVWMPDPALLKPRMLFTGKQVFTAVLMHYTRDQLPFTLFQDSKVPADTWGKDSGEGNMRIWNNQLLAGIIDKAAFGKHGLLHIYHELYGAERTSIFTAALSRLFTGFLQTYGFTCGMADVILVDSANQKRAQLLEGADVRALDAAAQFVGLPSPLELLKEGVSPGNAYAQRERSVRSVLSERFRTNPGTGAGLDMKVSGAMHPLSSEVVKACLPGGQVRAFRHNMMALMTVTGAKGSVVNFSQISCLLGQQELEGRRVPRMSSGKTLPCFAPYDAGARSGGFVGDRFLTGLRPQEYYFHCMAGREGLVDTTVKTSRSGYLQRCLVKNLESLKVAYDCTVRDDCDDSIVQFYYGEDGIDPMQTGMLRAFPFILLNMPQFSSQLEAAAALDFPRPPGQAEKEARAQEVVRRRGLLMATPGTTEAQLRSMLPLNAQLLQTTVGVTSEGFQDALSDALLCGGMLPPPKGGAEGLFKSDSKKLKRRAKKGLPTSFEFLDPMDFQRAMYVKYYRCQVQPGEAVGVIAAQSVGEPSTQMTLNTFHMAGRGEANVTLGIPRLREILMTAAASIKTPVMTLPLHPGLGLEAAEQLAVRLKRLKLGAALKSMHVVENAVSRTAAVPFGRGRVYTVRMRFHAPELYPPELGLKFEEITVAFQNAFVPKLAAAVKADIKRAGAGKGIASVSASKLGGGRRFGGGSGGSEEGGGAPLTSEERAPRQRRRSEKDDWDDENREENEEFEEGKLRFAGGRGEQATYEAGDEDDARIQRQIARREARREEEEEEGGEEGEEGEEDEASLSAAAAAAGPSKKGSKGKGGQSEMFEVGACGIDWEKFECEATVSVPLDCPKLLVRETVERLAAETNIRAVPGVTRSYILEAGKGGQQTVQTDGINIHGVWASQDIVQCNALTTNNPYAMLQAYGVEACRATIVKEVRSVFGAYGIGVDPRHLSLIADFMTHLGGYRACNRLGIESSTSPFLKISFETAARFLVDATLHGDIDALTSPASRIVLGQPTRVGTGALDLVHKVGAQPARVQAAA